MPDEHLIAVDKVANKIRFYDLSLRETKVLASPEPCVHELALSPDRATAFIPLYGDGIYGSNAHPNNKVLVVDLGRQEIADIIDLGAYVAPHGMVTTGDGKLWVVCDVPNKLLRIDPASRRVEAAYDNPAKGGHVLEKLGDGRKLYVSAKEGPLGIFERERERGAFVATVPVGAPEVASGNGSGSEGLAVSPDGHALLVLDNDRTDLHVIDTASNREIDRVPLLPRVLSNPKRSRLSKLAFSRDRRHLVVTSYATGLAWILDGVDYRRQTIIPVAKGPMGIAFPPDGRSALVSSHDSGMITRIDLEEKRAVAACDGGAGIEVMAFY